MVLATAFLVPTAEAETLYAATVSGYTASASSVGAGHLYSIDPASGNATRIAPIRVDGKEPIGITGLALHPRTGVLYGITAGLSPNVPRSLVTIDPATGNATLIGPLGLAASDIAFDSKGKLYVWLPSLHQLGTINIVAGVVTPLGAAGNEVATGGLALDGKDVPFVAATGAAGTLDTVDPATGEVKRGPKLVGATYASAINSLTFSSRGVLYAVNSNMGAPASTRLVTLDVASGAVTTVGALPLDTDALAFASTGPPQMEASDDIPWFPFVLGAIALVGLFSIIRAVTRTRGP
jgi:hypothetical protein